MRVRYYLPDRDDFEPCWPALRAFFADARPAATMLVTELADPRMRIEIEVTALRSAATDAAGVDGSLGNQSGTADDLTGL